MSRFDRVLDVDVTALPEPVPAPPLPRVGPREGMPVLYAVPVGFGDKPELWVAPVTVIDPGSGKRVKFMRSTVVMPLPEAMASDDALVTGDEVTFGDASGIERSELMPTQQLKDYKVGDRCLMPTRIIVSGTGRTCWVPVRIVAT